MIALTSNLAIAGRERIEFNPEWFDPQNDATPDGTTPRPEAAVNLS